MPLMQAKKVAVGIPNNRKLPGRPLGHRYGKPDAKALEPCGKGHEVVYLENGKAPAG